MFVVSLCENSQNFPLHKKNGNKFEQYIFNKDGRGEITSCFPSPPLQNIIIYGYHSNKNATSDNVYYDDYFAITEIEDSLYEHLMAEWGKVDSLLSSGLIFGCINRSEAVLNAKAKINGDPKSINTGTRPLSINNSFDNLPKATKVSSRIM